MAHTNCLNYTSFQLLCLLFCLPNGYDFCLSYIPAERKPWLTIATMFTSARKGQLPDSHAYAGLSNLGLIHSNSCEAIARMCHWKLLTHVGCFLKRHPVGACFFRVSKGQLTPNWWFGLVILGVDPLVLVGNDPLGTTPPIQIAK